MQIKTFKIPLGGGEMEEDLNRFLRGHRVLKVERAFCLEGSGYLAVCVEYMEGKADGGADGKGTKRDYAKELSGEELQRFETFRKIRRDLATERKLPAYMIFTDADLAVLARQTELTVENIGDVPGIQKSRLTDYGAHFITQQILVNDEASGQSDGRNYPF